MKVHAFIGFLLCSIFVSVATSELIAQNPPCGCEDKADLLNQLNRANAAMYKIQHYLNTLKLDAYVNEIKDAETTLTLEKAINHLINREMQSVEDKNARKMSFTLDPNSCATTGSADSACLKLVLDKIAKFQQDLCLYDKKMEKGGFVTVGEYLLKFSEMYKIEIAEILKLLRGLPARCRPGDWFGMIRYTELREMNTKESAKGREEASQDTLKRTGMISLTGIEGNPFSSWQAGGKHKETKDTKGTMYCTASDRWAKKETPYETHFIVEFDRNGTTSLNMQVEIGDLEEGNLVPIGFQIPSMKVMMIGKTTDTRNSGCPGDNINNNIPLSTDTVFESSRFNFKGRYFSGDPEKISGSETIDQIPAVKTDKLTMSNTVQISYNLYKLRR